MKKLFTLLALTGLITPATFAQVEEELKPEIKKVQASSFTKTAPLRDLLEDAPDVDDEHAYDNWVPKDRQRRGIPWSEIDDIGIPENNGIDPVLQSTDGWRDGSNMMKANWQGQSGALPPDPTGAVGATQYVQAVNSTFRVYDKDGNAVAPPKALHTLWPGYTSKGDPIVMYDRYADRWFISQFHYTGSGTPQAPFHILIAISETADALGSYYVYEFEFSSFPDYPKYSVWSNAYFMTANTGSTDCVAYERDKMLTGDPTASMITMYFPSIPLFFNSIAPAYAEGVNAPAADAPGWAFAVQDNAWGGVSSDHIKIFKITLDWDTPSNSDVVIHQSLNTSAFDSQFTPSWDDITQQGDSQKLDAVAGIFMYRAQWRQFNGYETMMLVHTVDVNGANRAGCRWYELRKDEGQDDWYVHQESTFDPNDGNSRWMGNAAMDLNGHIGLAYSIAGPSEYAGLRYTGRFASDPLHTMTVAEQTAIDGSGAQTFGNRFGDYSQMSIDPTDDATFWFTGEYLGPSGSRRSQIFSFAMWELVGLEEAPVSNPFFNAFQPTVESVKVIWKDLVDDQIDIRIMDMNGKLIVQESNIDATLGQKMFTVPSGASGIYVVSITGKNTNMSDKIYFAK